MPREKTGILVDEEFGADILRDARKRGYIVAMPTEKSGQNEYDFEYGDDFARHIDQFDPTFTKVLVRYNPEGDPVANRRQVERLERLNEYLASTIDCSCSSCWCRPRRRSLPRSKDKTAYDRTLRPALMERAISQLQDAGVEPDVWKIEGLDRREDCQQMVATARRGGRDRVGCIILGRGENEQKVIEWLETAATVSGFIGFAVGRSSFLQSILDLHAGKITADEAADQVAQRFHEWIDVFEKARGK